jgi:solute carrier family 25 (mitochondrial phosphate transporter), member 3
MTSLFPSQYALAKAFQLPAHPQYRNVNETKATKYQARPELYGTYSVVDDAKNKAQKLSKDAQAELEKASSKALAKTGKIQLYSGQYYAACTFGGLLACVSVHQHVGSKAQRPLFEFHFYSLFLAWATDSYTRA